MMCDELDSNIDATVVCLVVAGIVAGSSDPATPLDKKICEDIVGRSPPRKLLSIVLIDGVWEVQ